ncbi:MAG: dockerin type I domain-containing protein [Candidatus Zixiibacteriota bacterium]
MRKLYGDHIADVNCHASNSGDPFYLYDARHRMMDYYGVTGYPTAIFNGKSWVVGGGGSTFNTYKTRYTQQMAINTPGRLSLDVQYDPSSREGAITTKLYSVDPIKIGNLRFRYVVTESHYNCHWGGLDSLQCIMRDMLPDSTGVPFSINQGDVFSDSQSFYIDPGWADHNCELVVFVQSDEDTSLVISNSVPLYQAHVSGDANQDRRVTISDVVFLSNYVFFSGPEPDPSASGDPNEDGIIDIQNIAYLVSYLLHGGPAPLRGWEID